MSKENLPGRKVTEREARWVSQEAFGPAVNFLRAERSMRQTISPTEVVQPEPETMGDGEELQHPSNVIDGWWTLIHDSPKNPRDYDRLRAHVTALLRELRINVKRYPNTPQRGVLVETHFQAVVDPIMYLGIIGYGREPRYEAPFQNSHRTWNERRIAAVSKGYTVLPFQDYAEALNKSDLYRQFVGAK